MSPKTAIPLRPAAAPVAAAEHRPKTAIPLRPVPLRPLRETLRGAPGREGIPVPDALCPDCLGHSGAHRGAPGHSGQAASLSAQPTAARLVRRCACPGCLRLSLWPMCARHRPPELATVAQARFAGAFVRVPHAPTFFVNPSRGAGQRDAANPAGRGDIDEN